MIKLGEGTVDPVIYGWKSHYLDRVIAAGHRVPRAFALGVEDTFAGSPFEDATALAVRSSGTAEDSDSASFAGSFLSVLDVRGPEAVSQAVDAVRASATGSMAMGVIIQQMVDSPIASGVAFSCDPITLESSVAHISWVPGLGQALVDGSGDGHELRVSRTARAHPGWPFGDSAFADLMEVLDALDAMLLGPVDIEWSLDSEGEIQILQLRPVVLGASAIVDLVDDSAFALLPGIVRSHTKIALRRDAARLHVPMSRARAYVASRSHGLPDYSRQPTGHDVSGLSVVLLHPPRINGKVVRQFSEDCSTDVEFMVRGCQRYAIRQYPEESDATAAVQRTLDAGLEVSALACVIEQELLYAYATGIVRETEDGYIVEAAIGHFVPKGYVETSVFVLDADARLVTSSTPIQSKAYHFVNGHVVIEEPAYEQLDLSADDLHKVVATILPLMRERPGTAVEFGLQGRPGELTTYMIDIADGDAVSNVSADDIDRGVLSSGTASGQIMDIRDTSTVDDLNSHLHDAADSSEADEPVIYLARRASVDLLRIVRSCHPSSGFVFEHASMLSHLAVVLRERGLAAIAVSESRMAALADGVGIATIDTAAPSLIWTKEEAS